MYIGQKEEEEGVRVGYERMRVEIERALERYNPLRTPYTDPRETRAPPPEP